MKLGEAIAEREFLDRSLELLGSRVSEEYVSKVDLAPLEEEIVSQATRRRDLIVAIQWTEQNYLVEGLSLAAYRVRAETFIELYATLKSLNPQKARQFFLLAQQDELMLKKIVWLVDLQVPTMGTESKSEEE